MSISANSVVEFHYTVSDEDGVTLDSSEGREPLTYLHGAHNIIPGLEKAMEGRVVDDSFKVTVPAEEAYGEHRDELVENVPLTTFGEGVDVKEGMRFQAQTQSGPVSVVITAVNDEFATVDGNHPLAGKDLTFDVKVASIRDASEEELAHGHVHGPGGHEH